MTKNSILIIVGAVLIAGSVLFGACIIGVSILFRNAPTGPTPTPAAPGVVTRPPDNSTTGRGADEAPPATPPVGIRSQENSNTGRGANEPGPSTAGRGVDKVTPRPLRDDVAAVNFDAAFALLPAQDAADVRPAFKAGGVKTIKDFVSRFNPLNQHSRMALLGALRRRGAALEDAPGDENRAERQAIVDLLHDVDENPDQRFNPPPPIFTPPSVHP